jgi:hypothetical protein
MVSSAAETLVEEINSGLTAEGLPTEITDILGYVAAAADLSAGVTGPGAIFYSGAPIAGFEPWGLAQELSAQSQLNFEGSSDRGFLLNTTRQAALALYQQINPGATLEDLDEFLVAGIWPATSAEYTRSVSGNIIASLLRSSFQSYSITRPSI